MNTRKIHEKTVEDFSKLLLMFIILAAGLLVIAEITVYQLTRLVLSTPALEQAVLFNQLLLKLYKLVFVTSALNIITLLFVTYALVYFTNYLEEYLKKFSNVGGDEE